MTVQLLMSDSSALPCCTGSSKFGCWDFFPQPVQWNTKASFTVRPAPDHISRHTGYLASSLLPIDHQEPQPGWESLTVNLCVKYSNMHVCLCLRAFLILLNVNNNEWFLPQDTSEPLKLCFIYVSTGAGSVEKADIANKSLDTKRRWWGYTGESGWKWSTLHIDQFVWGYMICQEGPASFVRCSGLSVFPQSDLWPYLE